ncbi:hypothetical protein G9464_02575 [Halostella sp. JP-L12]|uniref:hypothetical protein n=1 Tax=Halostella TaxID=1843185 RepID=UPI000EF76BFA|nr:MULTISPECIES: hypothetical protein [Halostella]NHN46487.1 hypothetical protein [Halostella sp. JP-L12]
MIDEYIHPWDTPWERTDTELSTVLTTPEQLLTGVSIGVPIPEAQCADCGRTLREGENVVVYAYRAADATEWDVARCYCRDCGPDGISAPTLGTSETLVGALIGTVSDVGRQTHQFCLLDIERVDASPPTDGTEA